MHLPSIPSDPLVPSAAAPPTTGRTVLMRVEAAALLLCILWSTKTPWWLDDDGRFVYLGGEFDRYSSEYVTSTVFLALLLVATLVRPYRSVAAAAGAISLLASWLVTRIIPWGTGDGFYGATFDATDMGVQSMLSNVFLAYGLVQLARLAYVKHEPSGRIDWFVNDEPVVEAEVPWADRR